MRARRRPRSVGATRVSQSIHTFFAVFLTVFAALFPVVNPLGGAPIFLQFTRFVTPAVRYAMARQVAINGFIILVISTVLGARILAFFGISLPVLRVAGGMVVTAVGWSILHQGDAPAERTSPEDMDQSRAEEQAFYPLTMPLTVGPGSIATAVAIGAQRSLADARDTTVFLLDAAASMAGLLAIALSIYFAYRYADAIERMLGKTGTNVLVRMFAFILLAIGVQIMWAGVAGLIETIPAILARGQQPA